MAILAGIDEAGFGPVLGPLVVSGVAFRVPEGQLGACLWDLLRCTCTRSARGGRNRLVVADSKELYRSGGLPALERAVLVALASAGARPHTWRALLDEVSPGARAQLNDYPWYADTDLALPVSEGLEDVGIRANAVRHDCRERGIELLGIFSEPLPEGHYNRLVARTRNKSVLLLGMALRVADRILHIAPSERIRLRVDRLGGRKRYRDALRTAMPGYELQITEESEARSAYRLIRSSEVCEIEFVTRGDAGHFPIALASLCSKYLRELYMHAFNRYWSKRQDGLKPTAGYFTDAQRWLAEAAPAIDRLSIDRGILVRQR